MTNSTLGSLQFYYGEGLEAVRQGGTRVVRYLQYEVREGREAGEVVVLPKAFIAKRNQSFILQVGNHEGEEE